MNKQYKRTFLLTVSLILVSFVLLGISFVALSYRYTTQDRREALSADAQYVANMTGSLVAQGNSITAPNFQGELLKK